MKISSEEKRTFDETFSIAQEPVLEEDPEHYFELSELRSNSGIKTIVFAAMALESLINDYGAIHLGDSFFKKHVDKLDSPSKLIVAIKMVTSKTFPKGGQAYENLEFLFKIRNKLVHSKSKAVPFKNGEVDAEALDKMLPDYFSNWKETVNKCFKTIEVLSKTLHELVPEEDLFLVFLKTV